MNIGPLAFPAALLALLFGVIAGMAAIDFLARRGHADAGNALYFALGASLLLARIGYVVRWWPQYMQQPSSMLNIRDGGFDVVTGMVALLLAATLIGWKRAALRRSLAVGVLVGVAAWAFGNLVVSRLVDAAHPTLPAVVLQDLDGRDVALSTMRGQPSVINLWATWCGPCRREMPVLVEAQRKMPSVRFVFADQGESAAVIRQFLQAQGLAPTHVLLDEGMQLTQFYSVRGYPTTLFLDAQGHLRDTHVGELSRAVLAEHVARIGQVPTRPATVH
ncbi:MAG: TlpA family protein disulfide reductase [Xanthomonadaceae bacterium]|nr:TlpA family protein disulfide reductase [Xanthomonadaceae bacterium]